MNDVIIKGMEIPENCYDCLFTKTNDDLLSDDYRYMYCDFPQIGAFVTDYIVTRHPDCPLRPAPEWISAEERLPEDEKPVVARYGFVSSRTTGQYFVGTLTYFAFDPVPHWQHESTGLHVTHWMPLPEPPEGGDGE